MSKRCRRFLKESIDVLKDRMASLSVFLLEDLVDFHGLSLAPQRD